jgi:hypothetical protein
VAGYSWLQFAPARAELAERLADSGNVYWTDEENGLYIVKALRMFNALTYTWKTDFVYSSSNLWNSLALLAGSPRMRTLTDTNSYTMMEYHLLEPPTGGVWTGTTQFSISDLSQALQRRRDEMLQVSNCNQVLMPGIGLTPGTRMTTLPDTVIDVARVRYLPLGGSPTTLYRDDTVAQEFYEAGFWQAPSGTPQTFMLTSEPPLTWVVDVPPGVPGTYEAVVSESGTAFVPPTPTLLNVPDDFVWALEWGALADLLGRESEATDRQRAAYCLRRYQDGLNLLLKTPWAMLGKVNGQAVTMDSIAATDRYSPEWDSNPTGFGPVLVIGGIDFLAAPVGLGIGLTVLGNAPVPVLDTDYVQVSRSNWDVVLDLAQSLACFKMGGAEFEAALELESRAIQACSAENTRLKSMGSFSDILVQRGQAQDRNQERYSTAATGRNASQQVTQGGRRPRGGR